MGTIIHEYKGMYFDSQEEIWFAMWCDELKEAGFIQEWYQGEELPLTEGLKIPYVKTTQLKTKVKQEKKVLTLLEDSVYTPDFRIIWTDKAIPNFFSHIPLNYTPFDGSPDAIFFGVFHMSYVEVKPTWDMQNMTRVFVSKQKFLWDSQKLFVNLIKPEDLFKKTFMPAAAIPYFKFKKIPTKGKNTNKKVGDWKINYIPKTLNEFLNAK